MRKVLGTTEQVTTFSQFFLEWARIGRSRKVKMERTVSDSWRYRDPRVDSIYPPVLRVLKRQALRIVVKTVFINSDYPDPSKSVIDAPILDKVFAFNSLLIVRNPVLLLKSHFYPGVLTYATGVILQRYFSRY